MEKENMMMMMMFGEGEGGTVNKFIVGCNIHKI
jgi:hypothetical protein